MHKTSSKLRRTGAAKGNFCTPWATQVVRALCLGISILPFLGIQVRILVAIYQYWGVYRNHLFTEELLWCLGMALFGIPALVLAIQVTVLSKPQHSVEIFMVCLATVLVIATMIAPSELIYYQKCLNSQPCVPLPDIHSQLSHLAYWQCYFSTVGILYLALWCQRLQSPSIWPILGADGKSIGISPKS